MATSHKRAAQRSHQPGCRLARDKQRGLSQESSAACASFSPHVGPDEGRPAGAHHLQEAQSPPSGSGARRGEETGRPEARRERALPHNPSDARRVKTANFPMPVPFPRRSLTRHHNAARAPPGAAGPPRGEVWNEAGSADGAGAQRAPDVRRFFPPRRSPSGPWGEGAARALWRRTGRSGRGGRGGRRIPEDPGGAGLGSGRSTVWRPLRGGSLCCEPVRRSGSSGGGGAGTGRSGRVEGAAATGSRRHSRLPGAGGCPRRRGAARPSVPRVGPPATERP